MEKIFLSNRRGMEPLSSCLPEDFLFKAAQFCLEKFRRVILTSGFWILSAQAYETDGLPGAAALARALSLLGGEVFFVSDPGCVDLWKKLPLPCLCQGVDFPLLDREKSIERAQKILGDLQPSLLVAIERCGPTGEGRYFNMRGRDITPFTARVDCLFELFSDTVAIGDGGNEIGMGNLAKSLSQTLPIDPCITSVQHLIVAGVSNWGAYGLVRALEILTGRRDLLWDLEEEGAFIEKMVSLGGVDGFSGKAEPLVDGLSLKENQEVLRQIREYKGNE